MMKRKDMKCQHQIIPVCLKNFLEYSDYLPGISPGIQNKIF